MCNKRSEMVFGNQNHFCKNQMLYQMGLKKNWRIQEKDGLHL